MQIGTTNYQAAHNGKRPKGFGKWHFELLVANGACGAALAGYEAPGTMLYSHACKLAKKEAASIGAFAIRVAA